MEPIVEGFRLSPQQAHLWRFHQQSTAYQSWCSTMIEGQLDRAHLRYALETVLTRHEIFRTLFQRIPGVAIPLQVVTTNLLYTWNVISLLGADPHEQQQCITATFQAEKTRIMNVEQGPLVYVTLLELTPHTHLWLISLSALSADAHTLLQLVGEVAQVYHRTIIENANEPVQYMQFSEWQHELLEENNDDREYWRHIDHLPTDSRSALPYTKQTDTSRPFTPAVITVQIAAAHLETLFKQQYPLPVIIVTCWSILLGRLTGQDTICIGLNVDGRIEDLQETAGLLTKCLPFVCSLHSQQPIRKLLVQTQETYNALRSHQLYFAPDRPEKAFDASSLPYLFGFEWREHPASVIGETTSFRVQQWESYTEPFQVKLVALSDDNTITLHFHFDQSVLRAEQIQRIADQFSALIAHVIAQPEQPLERLAILSPTEQQLLLAFNRQVSDYPHDLCLHQLFEQQVARTPDAIAVESGQDQWTYAQLDQQANQLACYLQQQGVGPDVLVGLGLDRSIQQLWGILGILKAGGAYVPLETFYPEQRLAAIVEGAHLAIVVTQSQFRQHFTTIEQVICLDEAWQTIARYDGTQPPHCNIESSNLAYVLYTSGSTGQPKGVMIPHQGVVHYVDWSSKHYMASDGTGSLVHSPLSFDLTITSLFPALAVGRRLVLASATAGIDALRQELITHPGFSLLKITPAHLNLLLHILQPDEFAAVAHALIIGGEVLHSESVAFWRTNAPATRLINEYGPTETVVGCCIHEVGREEDLTGNIPIGHPIPNTQIYLLDAHLQSVPIGTPGEIYIGGVGVGRGYLNQPDMTAERFLANPFSQEPGARFYKTGDLARYLSDDGTLEYLGRCDHQVKVNGYRIELGEIEVVLRTHPAVQDAVVLAHEDQSWNKRLVAYLVAQPDQAISIGEMRGLLKERLPSYMLPSAWVCLDTLPLTSNGKVDRLALSPPTELQDVEGSPQEEARTPIEEQLVAIWSKLLQRKQISIHDDFFELGGHSLLATQLIYSIHTTFQIDLPLRYLFDDASTIARLAELIEDALIEKLATLSEEEAFQLVSSFSNN